jgi:hypothetical protein
MKKYFFILWIALGLSCSSVETDVSPIDLLSNGNTKAWNISSYTENGKELYTDCFSDDVFFFNKSQSSYIWKKGMKKCDPAEKDDTFSFALSEDNKTLIINGISWKVLELTKDNLVLETKQFSGFVYQIVYKAV